MAQEEIDNLSSNGGRISLLVKTEATTDIQVGVPIRAELHHIPEAFAARMVNFEDASATLDGEHKRFVASHLEPRVLCNTLEQYAFEFHPGCRNVLVHGCAWALTFGGASRGYRCPSAIATSNAVQNILWITWRRLLR